MKERVGLLEEGPHVLTKIKTAVLPSAFPKRPTVSYQSTKTLGKNIIRPLKDWIVTVSWHGLQEARGITVALQKVR
jgi:hypothetical protein